MTDRDFMVGMLNSMCDVGERFIGDTDSKDAVDDNQPEAAISADISVAPVEGELHTECDETSSKHNLEV